MLTCPRCGRESPESARFCSGCGTSLPAEPREVRKRVTVVFADLSGSTALGERLDPEALRALLRRYHGELRTILQRHGGLVEKFIGDAVMAVFGLPRVHEDDALRAVRAAAEMRDAVEPLGLQVRIGVNTGDVVAGEGETLVTGDAVNVAARLEQAAAPGEILLGEQTHLLVRDAVRAEPLAPLTVRGKAEPVPAVRLEEVLPDVPAFSRRLDSPFVGRESELRELETAFRQAVEERACRLCTVVGPPGIGKSRLARQLLARTAAQVLVGRCLPYGEGITYWPLAEILKQLPRSVAEIVEGEEDAEVIAARVAGAVGSAGGVGAAGEIAWAFRKLLERLARERPLIVVVDDVHWAEPTLLDLLEYIVSFAGDAPMFLLCLARADLFEQRPSWSNPRPNASLLVLDPLSDDQAHSLAERLVAARLLSKRSQARLLEAAEGNPLFVEQLIAMHAESGDGELEIPPTIQALLVARIDRLEPEERGVIECASVEGRLFHRGAVARLLPEQARPALASHLMTLVRKEFIRPDRALFPGDDGFRFGHILIRDAAYASLPKRLRGDLHERFADWLERKAADREIEFQEIVGYHLEQACRYRSELGSVDKRSRELGRRAGEQLGAAGERALVRSDLPAAENLLERALALLPDDHSHRLQFAFARCDTIRQIGDLERARTLFEDLTSAAADAGDARTDWRGRLEIAEIELGTLQVAAEDAATLAREAVWVLTELGDDAGLARAWRVAADACNTAGDHEGTGQAIRQALAHARRACDVRLETEMMFWLGATTFWGSVSATDALITCTELESSALTPLQRAHTLLWRSAAQALAGDNGANGDVARARAVYADLGMKVLHGGTSLPHALIERLRGDPVAAEAILRKADVELEEAGEKGYRSTVLAGLALALCEQGRYDEADGVTQESAAITARDDAVNVSLVSALRARVAAQRGVVDEAEQAARDALTAVERMDSLLGRADVFMLIAGALRQIGKLAESRSIASRALADYEGKGVLPGVQHAKTFIDEAVRG